MFVLAYFVCSSLLFLVTAAAANLFVVRHHCNRSSLSLRNCSPVLHWQRHPLRLLLVRSFPSFIPRPGLRLVGCRLVLSRTFFIDSRRLFTVSCWLLPPLWLLFRSSLAFPPSIDSISFFGLLSFESYLLCKWMQFVYSPLLCWRIVVHSYVNFALQLWYIWSNTYLILIH